MRKTSTFFYDPIDLPPAFPITKPLFTTPPDTPHVHNCFEIGLCRSGAGVFIVENKIFSCSSGDVIFINDKEFHILENASPLDSDWLFVNLDPVRLLAGWLPSNDESLDVSRLCGKEFSNIVHASDHPDITALAADLMAEMEKTDKGFESAVRALLWALLVKLGRIALPGDGGKNDKKAPGEITQLYPALSHISSRYASHVDMPGLAKRCGCSVSTFRRLFRRCFGQTPLEYLNEFRLKVAATLIVSTDRPIMEISLDSGFPTLSNFNRLFKSKLKASPREMRRKADKRAGDSLP